MSFVNDIDENISHQNASSMPQRQAITMIIKRCSKQQQFDAVTPTPLAPAATHACVPWHLGYNTPPQGSRGGGPTSTRWSLSLISDNAGPSKTYVRPSANINLVPIQSTVISSNSTASLTLRCRTHMCLERSLETGLTPIRLALLLSPYSVGFLASVSAKLLQPHNLVCCSTHPD